MHIWAEGLENYVHQTQYVSSIARILQAHATDKARPISVAKNSFAFDFDITPSMLKLTNSSSERCRRAYFTKGQDPKGPPTPSLRILLIILPPFITGLPALAQGLKCTESYELKWRCVVDASRTLGVPCTCGGARKNTIAIIDIWLGFEKRASILAIASCIWCTTQAQQLKVISRRKLPCRM